MDHPAVRIAALLLAGLLASVTGCNEGGPGGSGGSGGPDPDRDTIRSGLAALFAGDHATSQDTEDGTCFANALMGRTTPQELQDAGVLDASYAVVPDLPPLTEDLASRWAFAQFTCVDFVAKSTRAQVTISHGKLDGEAYAACLRDALTDDELRAAVVDTLTGDWDGAALSRFSTAQADCSRSAAG